MPVKKPTEILDFLANQDWLKPSPTTIAAGAVASGLLGWLVVLEDSWHPLWAILVGTGLCFLVVPRVLARVNAGRDAEEAKRKALEAKREAFHALAPEITDLLLLGESRANSLLYKDGETRTKAYHLLMRLRGEFQIDIPSEPSFLVVGALYPHLHAIAEDAHAKNLEAAQKLKAPELF